MQKLVSIRSFYYVLAVINSVFRIIRVYLIYE